MSLQPEQVLSKPSASVAVLHTGGLTYCWLCLVHVFVWTSEGDGSCFFRCMHRACCWAIRAGVPRCVSRDSQLAFNNSKASVFRPHSHRVVKYLQQGSPAHVGLSQRHCRGVACASSNVQMDSDVSSLIKQVHDHPAQAVFYATGGGMQVSLAWHTLRSNPS